MLNRFDSFHYRSYQRATKCELPRFTIFIRMASQTRGTWCYKLLIISQNAVVRWNRKQFSGSKFALVEPTNLQKYSKTNRMHRTCLSCWHEHYSTSDPIHLEQKRYRWELFSIGPTIVFHNLCAIPLHKPFHCQPNKRSTTTFQSESISYFFKDTAT